jgi:hypothetical protein
LEIEFAGASEGNKPAAGPTSLLRMTKLSADTLLCIFDGPVSSLTLVEPAEGTRFGFLEAGSELVLKTRYLDPQAGEPPGKLTGAQQNAGTAIFGPSQNQKACGVVDFSILASKAGVQASSSELALQLLISPCKFKLEWS